MCTWYVAVFPTGLPHASSSVLSHAPLTMCATPRVRAGAELKATSEAEAKDRSCASTHTQYAMSAEIVIMLSSTLGGRRLKPTALCVNLGMAYGMQEHAAAGCVAAVACPVLLWHVLAEVVCNNDTLREHVTPQYCTHAHWNTRCAVTQVLPNLPWPGCRGQPHIDPCRALSWAGPQHQAPPHQGLQTLTARRPCCTLLAQPTSYSATPV